MNLHYQSTRALGRRPVIEIPLSGSSIPASLKRIELQIAIAGRRFIFHFNPAPNLTYNFIWDRRDVYGRILQGRQRVSISIGYVYDALYRTPSQVMQSFAQFGNALTGNGTRQEITIWQRSSAPIGEWVKPPHFAGWSLDVHQAYEPTTRVLISGDGSRQSADLLDPVILTILNTFEVGLPLNGVTDLFVAHDGSIYFSGVCGVYRFGPGSTITRIAGTGTTVQCGFSGDGGPATQAKLWLPQGITMSPDGNLYIADAQNYRIRKVSPNGVITTIAGTGQSEYSGEGGPATAASLDPSDIAIGPDGSLYIGDDLNSRVLRIGTNGIITTVAGTGVPGYSGDGGLATQAQLGETIENLDVSRDGSIYISDLDNNRVRKVSPDGIITTIAGVGTSGFSGDGGPATAAQLRSPGPLAIGADGSLFISDRSNRRIRRVSPEGIINTVAGNGVEGLAGDNGPALAAQIARRAWLALGPDGSLYHTSGLEGSSGGIGGVIRLVTPPLPGNSQIEFGLASEDGRELYTFSPAGKHLRTLDALTNVRKYDFTYDTAGRLIEMIDIDSLITTIERDSAGNPVAIVSPFGQRTTFTLDANGYLASITNPASETLQFTYTADGLMTSMTDAKGNLYRYFYDSAGLLVRDEDPAGGFKTLSRTNLSNGYEVTLATAKGQSSRYRVEKLSTGDLRYTTIDASGLATVTANKLNGTTITTIPDGTVTTRVVGPDPRFGMEASLIKSLTVKTPSGLQSTFSQSRVITQMSGLTVTGQIDSVKINGRIYRTIYNGNLKQFTNISPEGRQTVTRVDSKGRVIEETVTGVSPITYTYDPQGRLIETLQADRRAIFAYDSRSRLASATDPLLRTTTFAYDSVGGITQQVLPGARQISYLYDRNGNLISLTPPGKPAHSFNYTSVNLTERYRPPLLNGDSTVTRYLYDLDKRLRNTIRPDSIAVSVFYDTLGCGSCGSASRPKTIIFDRGTLNFAYNSTTGLLDSLSAPGGNALTYNYDGTLPKKVTWSGEVQGNVEVTYDNNFRVTSQKVNGGNSMSFQYDNDGLLKAAGALTITRDAQNGRITGATLGNVTTDQAYNSFGESLSFHAVFASDTLFKTVYAQDSLGRITELTETIQGETKKFNYLYDAAGRLTDVSRNDTLLAVYTYDTNGNRLSLDTPAETFTGTYDAQDRLLTYGNASYTYTRNGELSMKIAGTDTTRYTYDALGNLVSVRLPNGTLIEYVIDGQNRRVGKKINGALLVKRWLYGNQLNIVAELDGAGNMVSRFVYGMRTNVPDHMINGGVTYRIVSDHLESVRLVVNTTNGTVIQRMDYDEFGNVINDTNPGFQPFGYAGGLFDEHTRFVQFMKRDYDAKTGRWTAKDPIGFEGGQTDLYVYVGNDPVNFTDPTGLGKICNRSGQNLIVVAGSEGSVPENAMVIGDNAMTSEGTDWDFVKYNGQWIKVPNGVMLVITKSGDPWLTVYQGWQYRIPFARGLLYWAGISVRPADSSYKKGEVKFADDIYNNVKGRRKAEGKGLEEAQTPCECR